MAAVFWASLALMLSGVHLRPGGGHICSQPCICYQQHASIDIYHVDCSRRRLVAGFPDQQDWPPDLQNRSVAAILDFRQNFIETVGHFPELPSVLSLSLRRNELKRIENGAFADLRSLELLDLSYNKLTGEQIRANIFSGSPNSSELLPSRLLALDLGFNNISYLDSKALENMHKLQELRVNNNPLLSLENSIQEALHSLNNLKILDISSTGISSIDETFLQSPSIKRSLRELNLARNHLAEVPTGLSILGSTLEVLHLNGNPILELTDTTFLGLGNLRQLSISEMHILVRIAPGTFDSLKRLEILFCSSNPLLNDIDKDAFRELKDQWPIKEVHLNNNSLESLPQDLLRWDKLDVLDIRDNPWTCDCRMSWFPHVLAPLMTTKMEMIALRTYCARPMRWSGVGLVDVPADEAAWCSPEDASDTGAAPRGSAGNFVLLALGVASLSALGVGLLCARRKIPVALVDTRYQRTPSSDSSPCCPGDRPRPALRGAKPEQVLSWQ